MTNPAAALPTPRRRVLEAQPGIAWEASASEAHDVRMSGRSCRFAVQSRGANNPKLVLQSDCGFVAVNQGTTACTISGRYAVDPSGSRTTYAEHLDRHPAGEFKALKIEADGSWSGEIAPRTTASTATQAGHCRLKDCLRVDRT